MRIKGFSESVQQTTCTGCWHTTTDAIVFDIETGLLTIGCSKCGKPR